MSYKIKKSPLLLSFLVLFLFYCGKDSHHNPNFSFDFSLPDLEGKVHSRSDFKDQILIVDFWATWCPPCLEEALKLNDLYERYRDKGVQVVGIALDKDSLELVEPFVKKNKITYPILVGDQRSIACLKDFKGVPTTILFDQKGRIWKRFDGSFDLKHLEETLQLLLEE